MTDDLVIGMAGAGGDGIVAAGESLITAAALEGYHADHDQELWLADPRRGILLPTAHLDAADSQRGGAVMMAMAVIVAMEESLGWFSLVVIIVLAVTLFLKPMKEIPWAGLVGMVAGGIAVFFADSFLSDPVFGIDKWIILVAIFLIVGAIVHMLFHFIEDALTIARMVLSWAPIMVVVGLLAIAEGVLILMARSIISFL